MSEEQDSQPPESVDLWVCPNCGSWYGSSTAPNLSSTLNRRTSLRNLADESPEKWGMITGPRSVCQTCKQQDLGEFERTQITYIRADAITEIADRVIAQQQIDERKEKEARSKQVLQAMKELDKFGH